MLTFDVKRKINTLRDILVGKVPDPKAQVEQITIALIYKFMDDMDISALFGNMLDNAIESVVKIKEREKRLIALHVIQDRQFIRIRTENYCEENVQFQDGIPITTKKDKRFHGYGMKSIKSTVEKYHGSVVAAQENNWFELKILLPAGG